MSSSLVRQIPKHNVPITRFTRAYAEIRQTAKTTRYDWSSFTNADISSKYIITEKNKFDTLKEISETHISNEEYENFVSAQIEATAECIPTKPRA